MSLHNAFRVLLEVLNSSTAFGRKLYFSRCQKENFISRAFKPLVYSLLQKDAYVYIELDIPLNSSCILSIRKTNAFKLIERMSANLHLTRVRDKGVT